MPRHARELPRPVLPLLAAGGLVAAVVVGGTLATAGAGAGTGAAAGQAPTVAGTRTVAPVAPSQDPVPEPEPDVRLSIVAAGDVLPHLPVVRSARTAEGYDFGPLLAPLAPWVSAADLALCHLEVPVAPTGQAPSGYPVFAAPRELAAGLADQGWDGCSTASNHSVDRGFAGVTATLEALDDVGLGHVGTGRSAAEAVQPQLYTMQREGREVTVAHLAATYGTNGMPVDAHRAWSVTLLDADDVVARAAAARAAGADLVLVSLHWGTEYRTDPTDAQRTTARALAESGVVDLVIGHHAHVPQPVELLPGGPGGSGMWVAYGLGNLVSNQDEACCSADTSSGLLLTAEVLAEGADPAAGTPAGAPRVVGVGWTPVTVDRRGGHRVHALADVPQGTTTLGERQVAERLARVRAAAGTAAPERTSPVAPTGPAPVVVSRPR